MDVDSGFLRKHIYFKKQYLKSLFLICYSPIDPQATTYCVVASHLKNYTSLCAAQCDSKANRENKSFEQYDNRDSIENREDSRQIDCATAQIDNKVEVDPFGIFEGNFKSVYRRKKFGEFSSFFSDS